MYVRIGKRLLDLLLVVLSLPATVPAVVLGWVAARVSTRSSGFFHQVRIGRDLRPFRIVKLRTMKEGAGISITRIDDPRITPIGRVLRRYKVDELPQLWNVLVGEMSLVGPRPEVPEWVARHQEAFAEHLWVRPGLSDLASLLYHDEARQLAGSGPEVDLYEDRILPHKLQLYGWYAKHVSLVLDLCVIALTLASIVAPDWAAVRAHRLIGPASADEVLA